MSTNGPRRGSLIASAALAGLVLLTPGGGHTSERNADGDRVNNEATEIVVSQEDTATTQPDGAYEVAYIDPSKMTEDELAAAEAKLSDPEIVPTDPQQEEVAEPDYIPYLDLRNAKTQDGHDIGLADIELIAATESDRLDSIVIVAFSDDQMTERYYRVAQGFRDEGAPIAGFIRAPEDGRNGFVVHVDGVAFTEPGRENRFNEPNQLAMVIEHNLDPTKQNASFDTGAVDDDGSSGSASDQTYIAGMDITP